MSSVPSDLQLTVGSVTQAGGRPDNEDSVLVTQLPRPDASDDPAFLLAVADGMGGMERGEVASKLAIDFLNDLFARDMPSDIPLSLKQAYRRANEAIYAESVNSGAPGSMGTTLVSAVIQGKYITIANVGDSRAYLMRANQVTQITQDHTVVAEQVAAGELPETAASSSPQRHLLTQALGNNDQLDRRMPSIYEMTLLPEDRVLLCSDGFVGVLEDGDYLSRLALDDPQQSAADLTALAVQRGTSDNVSAIVVAVSPSVATVQRETFVAQTQTGRSRITVVLVPALILIFLLAAIAVGAFVYF